MGALVHNHIIARLPSNILAGAVTSKARAPYFDPTTVIVYDNTPMMTLRAVLLGADPRGKANLVLRRLIHVHNPLLTDLWSRVMYALPTARITPPVILRPT